MRVGVSLVALAAERTTGLERYSLELVRALRAVSPPGLELVVYGPAWAHRRLGDVVSPPARLPRPVALELWLAARARRDRLDLLHTTAFAGPALSRVPQVLTVHDTVPWAMPETLSRGARTYFRPAQDLAFRRRRVAGLVTDARCTVPELRALLSYDGPADSAAVGLSADWAAPGALRPDDPRAPGPLRLLTVGTLEPRKGLRLVEQLAAELTRRGAAFDWRLVGRAGWGTSPPRGVTVVGAVDDGALLREYQRADLLLAPSLLEGFDLPVLEALACGTRVLASDIGVHREHFGGVVSLLPAHGVEAWADAVTGTSVDDASGARARRAHAVGFTWERTARAVLRTWERALLPT